MRSVISGPRAEAIKREKKKKFSSGWPAKKPHAKMGKIPSYRRQGYDKGTDLAFVEIEGKRHYLGAYGSPTSRELYHRHIAEWEAAGRTGSSAAPQDITVTEVAEKFLVWANSYYVKEGAPTAEPSNIAFALRPLIALYGPTSAAQFGPKALKAVRERMISLKWCRKHINKQVDRIKRMFKWAVADEYIPSGIYEALRAVSGLRFQRTAAVELPPIGPAKMHLVEAVKQTLNAQICAMIDIQLWTGARPGEVVLIRPMDIDRSGPVWTYKPRRHKNQHHPNNERIVYIGPKAQEILTPFLLRPPESYCFSPLEAETERIRQATLRRKIKATYGNAPSGIALKDSKRKINDRYTDDTYGKAIRRNLERLYPMPASLPARLKGEKKKAWLERLTPAERQEYDHWEATYMWAPNQLRHTYGTVARASDGLEAAQVLLGHSKADVTQIYAERDAEKAKSVALKIG